MQDMHICNIFTYKIYSYHFFVYTHTIVLCISNFFIQVYPILTVQYKKKIQFLKLHT